LRVRTAPAPSQARGRDKQLTTHPSIHPYEIIPNALRARLARAYSSGSEYLKRANAKRVKTLATQARGGDNQPPIYTCPDGKTYPVREVLDFWEGPIPGSGSIEEAEVSATEDRVDCWGWEGNEARIIRSAVTPSATKLNSQRTDIHSLPATTTALPLPASSDALEIAASPGVSTLASRTERGGPKRCVRWSPSRRERDQSR
jgi:hypothetical protein